MHKKIGLANEAGGRGVYCGVVGGGEGLVGLVGLEGLVGEVEPPAGAPIGVPIGPDPIPLEPEPPEAGPPSSAALAFICSIRGS